MPKDITIKGEDTLKTSQSEREGVLTANGRSRTKEGIRLMSRRRRQPTERYYTTRGHGRGARDRCVEAFYEVSTRLTKIWRCKELRRFEWFFRILFFFRKEFNPFTATGYFDIPPPRWPTFLVMLFPILKEENGSFIVIRIGSAVPRDQKVSNSRHMMSPKLRFWRGLKAKAPGAVTACVLGLLWRRSSKFLQVRRPRLAQEATKGKVPIFFFYLRGSFKYMIVILPTFWHSAPAWDFSWQLTRNVSLATMLVHSYRRTLDENYG